MAWSQRERETLRAHVVELAEGFPGVTAYDEYGHTALLLRGKRIAWYLVDHHGDGRLALWAKAPPGEQEALVGTDPTRYFVPAYLGPRGWIGVDLHAAKPDWAEVHSLLEQAWRISATKRAVTEFDRMRSSEG